MSSLDEIRADREKHKKALEEAGLNPYPVRTNRTHALKAVLERFDALKDSGEEVIVAGRLMSLRGHGKIAFVDLYDGTGRIQIFLSKENMDEAMYELFLKNIDHGDFLEFTGIAYVTERGNQAIAAKSWRVLAKALQAVPTEHFGIHDEDERYRKRYLDILLNKDVTEMVKKRSTFWNAMRSFLLERGFVEVETPILENTTGGADARPFVTHHNALDIDVYLRISAGELWQKRLMIAGLPKVFEIGRIFRNEGMSSEHLQDYTQLEFYQAYSDYREGMQLVTELYRHVAQETFGTLQFEIRGFHIDLGVDWQEYNYVKMVQKRFGIDVLEASESDVVAVLDREHIEYEKKGINLERAVDTLWKVCRKDISGPGFLINVPVYLEPLAKRSEDDPRVVERFQIILAGSEMGKGFSELNDPTDQKARFEHQQALRDAGDEEAQMADMEYAEALEYGMPPTFGFGVSERLFSFLMDTSVREAQLFPLMRPRE